MWWYLKMSNFFVRQFLIKGDGVEEKKDWISSDFNSSIGSLKIDTVYEYELQWVKLSRALEYYSSVAILMFDLTLDSSSCVMGMLMTPFWDRTWLKENAISESGVFNLNVEYWVFSQNQLIVLELCKRIGPDITSLMDSNWRKYPYYGYNYDWSYTPNVWGAPSSPSQHIVPYQNSYPDSSLYAYHWVGTSLYCITNILFI